MMLSTAFLYKNQFIWKVCRTFVRSQKKENHELVQKVFICV